jgi:putative ABC transport system permease protein
MNFSLLTKISIKSLKQHKGRSLLTMLGIIIGIASIIATMAIGKGAQQKLADKIMSMGNNYIYMQAGNWMDTGQSSSKKRRATPHFRLKDVEALKHHCHEIKYISPMMAVKQAIRFEGNNVIVEVKCGNEDFLKILNRKVKEGSNFTNYQVEHKSRVILLGSKTAKSIFKTLSPIGKTVYIKKVPFTVIGIIDTMENFFGSRDPNYDSFIPITTAKRYLLSNNDLIHGIAANTSNQKQIPALVNKIKKIFRYRRGVRPGEIDNFLIFDQSAMQKAAHSSSNILNLLLIIIASISLLVGGIGVMNIMLVSVTERTREIGIRMALGAQTKTILTQFVIESIMICFIGGIIGVIFGILIPQVASYFTGWRVIVTIPSILVSFLTTTGIGMFFGFYPAKKASQLKPVEALLEH